MKAPFFHRNRYRFFYPAGVISLVLLPLLGYLYGYNKPIVEQKNAIELNVYSPEQTKAHPDIFPDPITMRKYNKLYLTGDTRNDSLQLIKARLAVRQMLFNKDTTNGVQLIYGPKANYASFIQTLNVCLKENARAYTPYKNSFLILYNKPNPNYLSALPPQICGTPEVTAYQDRLYREVNEARSRPDDSILRLYFLNNYMFFWPTAILYLIMVALTIQKVVNHLQNHQRTTSN